jgi:hypothetical protein
MIEIPDLFRFITEFMLGEEEEEGEGDDEDSWRYSDEEEERRSAW